MRKFARVSNGEVVEIIIEQQNIEEEWHSGLVSQLKDITDNDPAPAVGWKYKNGIFSDPGEWTRPPNQEMGMAVANGFRVVSKDHSGISGTYDVSGPSWQRMKDEAQYIATFDSFSGGLSSLEWPTKEGEAVFSDPAQFKALVKGIADRLTTWQRYVDGKAKEPPSGDVSIP